MCAASQKNSLVGLDSTQTDGVNAVASLEEIMIFWRKLLRMMTMYLYLWLVDSIFWGEVVQGSPWKGEFEDVKVERKFREVSPSLTMKPSLHSNTRFIQNLHMLKSYDRFHLCACIISARDCWNSGQFWDRNHCSYKCPSLRGPPDSLLETCPFAYNSWRLMDCTCC